MEVLLLCLPLTRLHKVSREGVVGEVDGRLRPVVGITDGSPESVNTKGESSRCFTHFIFNLYPTIFCMHLYTMSMLERWLYRLRFDMRLHPTSGKAMAHH